jgi:hypothetical protein
MNGGTISGNNSHNAYSNVRNHGIFTMYDGIIDGASIGASDDISRAGNVGVYGSNATFTMYGGTISGSARSGVIISNANFIMHDGIITGNSESGVSNSGTFFLHGGMIYDNTTDKKGGGVYNAQIYMPNTHRPTGGIFTMTGGSIHSNTASGSGGGVHIESGDFTFDGGWIFDNNAGSDDDFHISPNAGAFNNNVFDPIIGAIGSPPRE